MHRVALALWILPASAAVADAADAPSCRLTPSECARALHEVAADAEALAADGQVLGLGLSPPDRARALLRRDAERMAERIRRLPPAVAAEVTRMQACRADADGIRGGDAPSDPLCR